MADLEKGREERIAYARCDHRWEHEARAREKMDEKNSGLVFYVPKRAFDCEGDCANAK